MGVVNVSFGEPYVYHLDYDGNYLRTVSLDVYDVLFQGSSDSYINVYTELNHSNSTFISYFDLYNSDGVKVVSKQKIGEESYNSPFEKLDFPTQVKRKSSLYRKGLIDTDGEIHLLTEYFSGDYVFLTLDSSEGKSWVWWKNIRTEPLKTSSPLFYPLQIVEEGDMLVVHVYSDGELFRFRLGKDYSFDDCLREPFWNKLDMF